MRLNKLEDATAAFENALKSYKTANYAIGQGIIYSLFGSIYLDQGKLNEAEDSIKNALKLYTMTNNAWGLGEAFGLLGCTYMMRGQLHDAKGVYEKAIDFDKKAQNHVREKEDGDYLDAVIAQIKEGSSVK